MRCYRCLAIFSAFGYKLIDHRLRRRASQQVSALWLVNAPFDFLEIYLGPAAREFFHVELLEWNSRVFQEGKRATLECAIVFDHPEHSDGEKELSLPLGFVLLPKNECARGEF